MDRDSCQIKLVEYHCAPETGSNLERLQIDQHGVILRVCMRACMWISQSNKMD